MSTNGTRQRWKRANKAKLNTIFGIQLSAILSFSLLTEKKKKKTENFVIVLQRRHSLVSTQRIHFLELEKQFLLTFLSKLYHGNGEK